MPPESPQRAPRLLTAADLAGTFVFAVAGAEAAAAAGLDVFGVLVIAFVTALGGGIVRDVLIGAVPPAALQMATYPVVAFTGGTAVILLTRTITEVPEGLSDVLDAGGLSLFAVVGAAKALDYGLQPLSAALLGAVSAVGGGVMRDVLLNEVPAVLRVDVYATAALAGAAVLVILMSLRVGRWQAMLLGGLVTFGLRLAAMHFEWNLPAVSS